jgi:ribulose-5-phosphate 4-epimerase/fuculose-1-phosphate aldolase
LRRSNIIALEARQRKLNDIWGHVSARLPAASGQEGFMLAHLRIPFKPAPPDELYCFDYQGRLLEGQGQIPWEIPLYTNIYRVRPDVEVSSCPSA